MTHICKPKVADEGTQHYVRLCDGSEMQKGDVVEAAGTPFEGSCADCMSIWMHGVRWVNGEEVEL